MSNLEIVVTRSKNLLGVDTSYKISLSADEMTVVQILVSVKVSLMVGDPIVSLAGSWDECEETDAPSSISKESAGDMLVVTFQATVYLSSIKEQGNIRKPDKGLRAVDLCCALAEGTSTASR